MRTKRWIAALGAAGVVVAALGASPARAIVYGDIDSTNEYENVGGLVAAIERDGTTFYRVICTGTYVGDQTFLTAAHCLTPGLPPTFTLLGFGATFEVDVADIEDDLAPDTSSVIWGTAAFVSPEWFARGVAGDGGDVGTLQLERDPGVDPATLAPAGYLDGLSNRVLRSAIFDTAGYGAIRIDQQGGNWAIYGNTVRRWATQSYMSKSSTILRLSMNLATGNGGTCYGDSGGPHFHDGAIVSITSTGDTPCKNLDTTYRVDTAPVHALVGDPETHGVEVWSAAP